MNDSLKKLRKELGKPESVTKVWTTQGKKMIFDFHCNGKKVFWEAKIENGLWSYYVKARNKDSVDFVLNVVLQGELNGISLGQGELFPDGEGRWLLKDQEDSAEVYNTVKQLFQVSVNYMNELKVSSANANDTELSDLVKKETDSLSEQFDASSGKFFKITNKDQDEIRIKFFYEIDCGNDKCDHDWREIECERKNLSIGQLSDFHLNVREASVTRWDYDGGDLDPIRLSWHRHLPFSFVDGSLYWRKQKLKEIEEFNQGDHWIDDKEEFGEYLQEADEDYQKSILITISDFILHIDDVNFLDAMYNHDEQGKSIRRLECSNSKLGGYIDDEEASIDIPLEMELNKEQFLKQQSIDPLPIFHI
ncbi:hypothetical protein OAN33_02490 [Flavobacteriales bacterium]|nr:hypothetical protein [Flavobacteriales bacterium]